MAVGGIGVMGSAADVQRMEPRQADSVSKGIQDEIESVQRQRRALSSQTDLSAEERMRKRQEMQQEISSLNARLRQRESELEKEQKRESVTDTRRTGGDAKATEGKAAKEDEEEAKSTGEKAAAAEEPAISHPKMRAMAAVDSAVEQGRRERAVITRMEDGIVILKGEIRQDEMRGVDTERKQQELEKQEEKVRNASASRFSALGEAYREITKSMRAETDGSGEQSGSGTELGSEDKVTLKFTNYLNARSQAGQEQFSVSTGI